MEDILEIHQEIRIRHNDKYRREERKKHQQEDYESRQNPNIMDNERQQFTKLQGSHAITNEIKKMKDITYSKVSRNKDKSDYSVVEKVIDKKTEILFEKWQKSGFIKSVEGCISAGKEANVYFSPAGSASESGKDYAIKIYKVETMVFRDREQYIDGEFRFRKGTILIINIPTNPVIGHCRTNPRKLIKLWAEKEYRNLKRMVEHELPAPNPVKIKDHVLVIEFIGEGSKAAPRKPLIS